MRESRANVGLPRPLQVYIALVGIVGMALLVYLVRGSEWEASTLGEMGFFMLLMVVAGSFPLPVAPRVKTDVTTAVWFISALVLEPGVAALAGVVAVVTHTVLLRFWGDKLRLPWYKYPFNAGQVALTVGLTSVLFHALTASDGLLTPAIVPAAAVMYLVNTALVSGAASLQLGMNPLCFWWMGTRENGLAELSLFSFGFLGAVVYRESQWTVVALFIPVVIIYIAFSRLARANAQLADALEKLESLQGRIVGTSKLASIGAISLDLAHQIKNPLAILMGRLEGLRDRLDEDSRDRRHADIAMDQAWRIQELTETFAAIGQQRWVQLDVGELLDEAYGMAGLRNNKMIETRRDYQDGTLKIRGNPVLIREALSNIFSNSMEAVEDGGLITVGASRVNGSVIVNISDNGPGIANEMMGHIFEPFHSTKSNGHGLGLFATKHIVEMHDGTVTIDSVNDEGTCVILALPVASTSQEGLEASNDSSVEARPH